MCDPVTAALAIGAVAGVGSSVYQADQQRKAQNKALDAQKQAAAEAAKPKPGSQSAVTPEAFRRRNQQEGLLGVGGTLLTGPQGIPPGLVSTGKTLLGS